MLDALLISQILLWALVLSMAVMMLALLRQVGVLHERIAPMGALTLDRGPKEGEAAPLFEVKDLRHGTPFKIGGARGRSTLLFFLSPTCPVCKKLLPIVRSIQQAESSWLDVVLTSDGEPVEHQRFIRAQHLEDFPYVLSSDVGMTYRIGKLPYGVVIDDEGVIRAKGLLNTREHLESLIEAKQMGVPSIQQFLQSTRPEGHEPHEHSHDGEHDHVHGHSHDHSNDHSHDHSSDHSNDHSHDHLGNGHANEHANDQADSHEAQPLAASGKPGRK